MGLGERTKLIAHKHAWRAPTAGVSQPLRMAHVGRGKNLGRFPLLDALAKQPRSCKRQGQFLTGSRFMRSCNVGHRFTQTASRDHGNGVSTQRRLGHGAGREQTCCQQSRGCESHGDVEGSVSDKGKRQMLTSPKARAIRGAPRPFSRH
eukprot:gene23305-29518_t